MINLLHLKKYLYINIKRRIPTCYLLSSKSLLTIAVILFVYFLTMDIILFGKARNRGPFRTFHTNTQAQFQTIDTTSNKSAKLEPIIKIGSVFQPLPVKKIMMAEVTHFIRSPIAEFVEHTFNFSEFFA